MFLLHPSSKASPGQANLVTRSASGFSAQELYAPSSPSSSSLPSSPWNTIPNSSFEVSLPAHLKSRGHDAVAMKKKVETPSQLTSSQQSLSNSSLRVNEKSSPSHERTHTELSKGRESKQVLEKYISEVNAGELRHSPSLPDSSYQETPSSSSFPSPSPSLQKSPHGIIESQPEFGSPAQLPSDLFITPTSSPYPSPPPSPHPTSMRTYNTFFSKIPHK